MSASDRDLAIWLIEAAEWMLADPDTAASLARAALLTPTEDDFPVDAELEGHALALDWFAFVKHHAGVEQWDLELVVDEAATPADALRGMPHPMTEAPIPDDADDDRIAPGEPLPVPYDLRLLSAPEQLVAVMARGIAHYRVQELPTDAAEEQGVDGRLTDVMATLMGFGVFACNAAFTTRATESGMMIGWGWSKLGDLSQYELAWALALFAELHALDAAEVGRHLTTNPRAWVRDARRALAREHAVDLARLRAYLARPALDPYRSRA